MLGAEVTLMPLRNPRIQPLWFFAQTFVIGLDLYIVSPLLPQIMRHYHIGASHASLLVTVFALTYAIASPFWGYYADSHPRQWTALWALTIFIVGDVLTALGPPYVLVLASRVLAAVGAAGFTPTLYAYIADHVPYRSRAKSMGVASAGFSSATFLGIPTGLIVANALGWTAAFWLIFVLALCSLVITRELWIRSPIPQPTTPPSWTLPRPLWGNVLMTGLAFGSFGTVYTYLPLYLVQTWHITRLSLTIFMMVFGLAGLIGTLSSGRLGDRFGNLLVIRWGMSAEIATLVMLLFTSNVATLWTALLAYSFVSSYTPSLKALISHKGAKGLALAWNNSAMYLGLSVGSALGGWLWHWHMSAVYGGAIILLAGGWLSATSKVWA
ncbi:hypothetical protein CO251_04075 [Sulfobacillus sp. hq2]|nr:hypothetical protein CO251_04075 [Sulfobacillus sp. hq2]